MTELKEARMLEQYAFPKPQIAKWIVGLWMLAVLMTTRDCMIAMSILGFYRAQIIYLGIIACAVIVFLGLHVKKLGAIFCDARTAFAAITVALVALSALVKLDMQLMYLSILVAILFGIFVSYFLTIQEAAEIFVAMQAVMAVYSVAVTYFLRPLAIDGFITPSRFINPADYEFYDFIFAYVPVSIPSRIRNYGVYREPGVYQYFLILAFFLNNYVTRWRKETRYIVNIILAITVVSTYATGGVVELFLLAVLIFFDKEIYKQKWAQKIAIPAAVFFAGFVAWNIVCKTKIHSTVMWMLNKVFTSNESSNARYGAIVYNAELFLKHPIFGNSISKVLTGIPHNTSSSAILFAIFGCVGGMLHLLGWVTLCWNKKRMVVINLGILLVMLMSFNTENLITNPFFWLFPTMAICYQVLPQCQEWAGDGLLGKLKKWTSRRSR